MSTNSSPLPFLTEGDRSSSVKLLQRFLVLNGYFKAQSQQGLEPVDGNFGKKTTAEVMKLQEDHFLKDNKDGKVGGLTWCAIAFPTVDPHVRGALSPITNGLISMPLLKVGDHGAAVFVLQRLLRLYTPKYVPGNPLTEIEVDGVFGGHTETAVKIFQRGYKDVKLTVDGQVGDATWGALSYPSGQRSATQVAV